MGFVQVTIGLAKKNTASVNVSVNVFIETILRYRCVENGSEAGSSAPPRSCRAPGRWGGRQTGRPIEGWQTPELEPRGEDERAQQECVRKHLSCRRVAGAPAEWRPKRDRSGMSKALSPQSSASRAYRRCAPHARARMEVLQAFMQTV